MVLRHVFKISLIVLMAIAFSIHSSGKEEEVVTSEWAVAPPKVDGVNQDWAGIPLISQKYGVNLGFTNDEKYFYILFVFSDPKYLTSIEATGMSVYFNTEGEKKKDHGINFRKMQITADQYIAMLEEKQGPLTEEQKARIRVNKLYSMFHYGILSKSAKEILKADESEAVLPAVFRTGQQQKTLIYEFAIPLERAAEMAPGIGTEIGKQVMVGFEWGGWSRELKQAIASSLADAGSRARDQKASDDLTGSGGDPSGVRRMSMDDAPDISAMRRRQPKEYTLWLDVKLAEKR